MINRPAKPPGDLGLWQKLLDRLVAVATSRRHVALALVFLTTGCVHTREDLVQAIAAQPAQLSAHQVVFTHDGLTAVWAHPTADTTPTPASCIASLDGQVRGVDRCRVNDEPVPLGLEGEVHPWAVTGSWERLREDWPGVASRLAIQALDQNGTVIAVWSGTIEEGIVVVSE